MNAYLLKDIKYEFCNSKHVIEMQKNVIIK